MARAWKGAHTTAALALCMCASSVIAQANIVLNGGFESGLASWSTTSFFAQGFDFGIDNAAHTGSNAFFGGAVGELGFLSQTLPTTVGVAYDVNLWLASDGFLPNQFRVVVNGQTLFSRDDVFPQSYSAIHTTFVASTALSQLQFGFRDDSGVLHLDDVSVSAVPEPAVSALMAVGLGALALLRRRRPGGTNDTDRG